VRFKKHRPYLVIGMLFLTLLVFFDRSPGAASRAQSNDAADVRNLIERLFGLYQQKDLNQLISHWNEKSPFLAENKKILQDEFAAYEKIVVNGFDIRKMEIEGDEASLRVLAEMTLTRSHMVKPGEKIEKKNRTIELVNEGGVWKVWKFVASEEELAAAIIDARTEEERKALMERAPELLSSDLAAALIRRNYPAVGDKGNYQRALAINQLARKLAEQTGDHSVIAEALMNAGYIHGWVGTPEKFPELALEYLRKYLKIGEEFGFKDVIAKALIRSGVILFFQSEFSQAAELYQKGLKLAEELGDFKLMAQAMNNLSIIRREDGDYAKSLELALKSLKILENQINSNPNWALLSKALQNIGSTFASQDNLEQALAYYQKALEAAEKGITLGDIKAKASKENALALIGKVYLEEGNPSLAMDYFQKNRKLMEEIWDILMAPKDAILSVNEMNLGDVFAAENKTPQAIAYYQEALRLAEKSRDRIGMPSVLLRLGKMHLLQGDYREALAFAVRAHEMAEQVGIFGDVYGALVIAAKAHQGVGQSEEAQKALTKAMDLNERIRKHLVGGELDRQRSFEKAVAPYQAMIDLQVKQKQFKEAFSYAQRAKGRTLLELLQNGRSSINKSISPAERRQELLLSSKIVSLNRQITTERLKTQPDEKRLAEFQEQLKKARSEFEAFQTTFYATHPELRAQRGEIRPVSFDDVADLIPDTRTALLDFIVTDENTHLFVLTRDASARPILNTYTVKIERKALGEKVERFRRRMENRDYDFQKLSQELYELLLKPVQKPLQNKTNLIISPDNVLWDLPFQVLLSPEKRYLIEGAAISYAPSLSVLREMRLARRNKQAPAKRSLLALGNPELGKQSIETARFVKMDVELQPLPEAAAQVRALGRLYGPTISKVYTGPAAKEELVKEQSARYRILHLATHGIFNDASPMYSHIMLSQTSGEDDDDGLLEAWEMMNLDLNADLVVLSACETARGRVGAGEGMIGMTWALFVAGCPRTAVSQWKVEASSTTALMVEFHRKFKTRYGGSQPKFSTAEAMRQAALKVMKNPKYVHPFYWGGFVVIGDGN
jgi:CHAT domain-containing protein/TPR repeat protein